MASFDPTRESLLERFLPAFEEGGVLSGARRALIAVSGGPDSTALALLVRDALARLGDRPAAEPAIFVGHVNHGLRGDDGDADEAFVRELAARLGFPFVSERVSVPAIEAEEGLSTEAAARKARYAVFRRWAAELALDAVLTAHHREDQQETLVLRLCRGTGLRGLRGIPAERPLEGSGRPVRVVRPLLDWAREELVEYLRLSGQDWREDWTNRLRDRPRNRIRHEVLPLLEEAVHPGVRAGLERLSALARQLTDDLEELAGRCLDEALIGREGQAIELDARAIGSWPASVRREAFVLVVSLLEPERPPPPEQAFARFESLIADRRPTRAEDLGGGLVAERRYGRITVFRRGGALPDVAGEVRLTVGGPPVPWRGWVFGAESACWPGSTAGRFEEWVDADSVGPELVVRSRRDGDAFQPLGSPGRKKLKEFFRERRVPPRLRDSCPLVLSGGEIVWVVGERLAHPFRVRAASRRTVRLYARREGEVPAEA